MAIARLKAGYEVLSGEFVPNRTRKEVQEEHDRWAIPYADLVTLLLAFFVVMYAISSVDVDKYKAISASIDKAFTGDLAAIDTAASADREMSDSQDDSIADGWSNGDNTSPISMMDKVINQIEATMSAPVQTGALRIHRTPNGIEIELSSDILFSSGSAMLSSDSVTLLQKLATALKSLPYPIQVEGHTDNMPIKTAEFPSNWQLSAARAASVVGLFIAQGINPKQLAVIGYGEYRPIADNQTQEGRNRNRRVIVLIPTKKNFTDHFNNTESIAHSKTNP